MRKLSIKYQFCLALAICLVSPVCIRQATMQTDCASTAEEEHIPRITQWIKSFLGFGGDEDNQGRSSMVEGNDREYPGTNSSLPDGVFIDWRRTNCLGQAYSQGDCGSCAVFSVLSLYEWAFCRLHGNQIDFSKQYVIDCSSQMGMSVCRGGMKITDLVDFVNDYGFELTEPYAYKGEEYECPYNNLPKTKQKRGLVHLNKPDLRLVAPHEFEEQLKKGPIVASFYVGKEFAKYRGGIDTGARCNEGIPHSMLIIGSGREKGEEYWILRNSYGVQWGEKGYYRLKKINNCQHFAGFGWSLQGSLVSDNDQTLSNKIYSRQLKFIENPNYDWGLMSEKLSIETKPMIPWKEV